MKQLLKKFAVACAMLFPASSFAASEEIVSTTLCELASHPDSFNHKLIKVAGEVTHGYRLFTLTDACKPNLSSIWLNYGGLVNPPSVFNPQQADAPRLQQMIVEGMPTTLLDDALFIKFDKMVSTMSDRPQAKATIVGRYFAGHPEQIGEFKLWKGYGPMNCCTLLVIQQVLQVEGISY
ncbi:MAG TPA: hypothetical protein VHL14_14700 [Steroidobacteraceae bacterium]|nr:hypothetical protein [Steroidobacteraceae bacterium]